MNNPTDNHPAQNATITSALNRMRVVVDIISNLESNSTELKRQLTCEEPELELGLSEDSKSIPTFTIPEKFNMVANTMEITLERIRVDLMHISGLIE